MTNWQFEIDQAMSGKGDWFTSRLLRLISRADPGNIAKIRLGFPEEVAAWERWQASPDGKFE